MSLIPMLFSDWWEGLDRPHRLWDQRFGLSADLHDALGALDPENTDILLYRPQRRYRRRYHPFLNDVATRKNRDSSIVHPDKNKFQVTLDVQQFAPEEITVKVTDDKRVVVTASHEEKRDEHGWISRQFVRKYLVPSQCDIDKVESHLSSDGILSITVPRRDALEGQSKEKTIEIRYTGKPAITDHEDTNRSAEAQNGYVTDEQQEDQQQEQQQQQQQQARSRKTANKRV
ncbi:hypothetical protein KM043_000669 [Ampulex compressa]|nr:hypothetical protein KM043_000669 [Ampulex compressa]